jgi:hypothetical protein
MRMKGCRRDISGGKSFRHPGAAVRTLSVFGQADKSPSSLGIALDNRDRIAVFVRKPGRRGIKRILGDARGQGGKRIA